MQNFKIGKGCAGETADLYLISCMFTALKSVLQYFHWKQKRSFVKMCWQRNSNYISNSNFVRHKNKFSKIINFTVVDVYPYSYDGRMYHKVEFKVTSRNQYMWAISRNFPFPRHFTAHWALATNSGPACNLIGRTSVWD